MNAFKIVYSLLRVPRLFAALLLFPILGALVIVTIQLIFTASALTQISTAKNIDAESQPDPNWNFLRLILFADGEALRKEPILCLWQKDPVTGKEQAPSHECAPDRLDVALVVKDATNADYEKYLNLIKGNAYRLHVCKDCKPALRILQGSENPEVQISSIYGLMLYQLIIRDEHKETLIKDIRKEIRRERKELGNVLVSLPNLKKPINFSAIDITLATVLNITALAVIALWLGLKAHRKVLEYFSKSGALLPMVAATGKKSFYSALWLITVLRVLAFLLASVPLLAFTIINSYSAQTDSAIEIYSMYFIIWILALFSGLSLATIIASIADLKNRHELLSIAYKLVPLLLSGLGALFWALTFFGIGDLSGYIRGILVSIPILGLGPIILSQVVQVPTFYLLLHLTLSLMACRYLLKKNTHWFAAHLEEI